MISGELLFCGGSNWDLTGRKTVPKAGEKGETFSVGLCYEAVSSLRFEFYT